MFLWILQLFLTIFTAFIAGIGPLRAKLRRIANRMCFWCFSYCSISASFKFESLNTLIMQLAPELGTYFVLPRLYLLNLLVEKAKFQLFALLKSNTETQGKHMSVCILFGWFNFGEELELWSCTCWPIRGYEAEHSFLYNRCPKLGPHFNIQAPSMAPERKRWNLWHLVMNGQCDYKRSEEKLDVKRSSTWMTIWKTTREASERAVELINRREGVIWTSTEWITQIFANKNFDHLIIE